MNAAHNPYHVKRIAATAPNAYHVVNTQTMVTHSAYDSLDKAKRVCKDLSRVIRRDRALKGQSTLKLIKGGKSDV